MLKHILHPKFSKSIFIILVIHLINGKTNQSLMKDFQSESETLKLEKFIFYLYVEDLSVSEF